MPSLIVSYSRLTYAAKLDYVVNYQKALFWEFKCITWTDDCIVKGSSDVASKMFLHISRLLFTSCPLPLFYEHYPGKHSKVIKHGQVTNLIR